jgi:hypothetical protein
MRRHVRRHLRLLGSTGGVALAATVAAAFFFVRRPAPAAARPPSNAPTLTLLVTEGRSATSGLVRLEATLADRGLPPPVATVEHLPEAGVRGALLGANATAMVVADRLPVRDRSWGASLLRVEPGRAAVELCDRVGASTRPLVTPAGRVFVERGRAGAVVESELRVDELTIEEVDPAFGATRVVWQGRGYTAHLAAAAGNELIVYRVDPSGAALLAVDADSGRVRAILPSLPPFARDFSVAGGALVFENRDEAASDRWVIDRVALDSGGRRRLVTSANQALAPHVWPGGDVAYNGEGERGLVAPGLTSPLGVGHDLVKALSPDGKWAAVLHYPPAAVLPELAVLDVAAGRVARVPRSEATHVEVVGLQP